MVDASVDARVLPARFVGDRAIRVVGPIGKAVQDAHFERFLRELERLALAEARITIRRMGVNVPAIYVDGGHVHAYGTYAGLAEEVDVDTDLWTAHVRVFYSTEAEHYDILDETGKVGVYRSPEFCAAVAINAVKAHMAFDFRQIPVTQQYTHQDLALYAAAARQRDIW